MQKWLINQAINHIHALNKIQYSEDSKQTWQHQQAAREGKQLVVL